MKLSEFAVCIFHLVLTTASSYALFQMRPETLDCSSSRVISTKNASFNSLGLRIGAAVIVRN